jgi:hypothetical protein
MFLLARLDRANHVEAVAENRFCAHIGKLPVGHIVSSDWRSRLLALM